MAQKKFKWWFLGSLFFICAGVFYYKLNFAKNDKKPQQRVPSSLTLYTSEVESRSKKLIEQGRELHEIENYRKANEVLSQLLDQYPYTGYTEEASFLLAKGLLYERDLHGGLSVIQKLQEYAPRSRSKWTGYAILVKGKIHEEWGEKQKAIDTYRQILSQFSDPQLINEAEDLLLDVAL